MEENESVLIRYFGNSPELRIIDFLLENRLFDYSKKQIMEGSGISKATLFKHWKAIEKMKLVHVTRIFGKTKLYKLNEKSPVVRKIIGLELELANLASPKTLKALSLKA